MTSTSGRKSKRPPNKGSNLIFDHENTSLFTLIGRDCVVCLELRLGFWKKSDTGFLEITKSGQITGSDIWGFYCFFIAKNCENRIFIEIYQNRIGFWIRNRALFRINTIIILFIVISCRCCTIT